MRKIVIILFMLMFTFQTSFAQAPDHYEKDASTLVITPELLSVAAGDTFSIALTLTPIGEQRPLWNIEAPKVSQGSVVNLQKPVPTLIKDGSKNKYGYDGPVTVLLSLSVPINHEGHTIDYELDGNWPFCADVCGDFPIKLKFSLDVGLTVYNEAAESLFTSARANLPNTSFWSSEMQSDNDEMLLLVHMAAEEMASIKTVQFYPYADGVLLYGADQSFTITPEGLYIISKREAMAPMATELDGILSIQYNNGESINVIQDVMPSASLKQVEQTPLIDMSILELILYALIGGIILNLMPCVFPVLSLKALALLRSHQSHRSEGWAYTAGILTSFILIAITILAIRNGGETIGWGFQLQEPIFVAAMVFILVAVGLSLSGLYTIQIGIEGAGNSLTESQGPKGSFFTGVLAALVATPCTAPFMAPAIGYAITQPMHITLLGFAALGFGLALPFLLLSYFPILSNILPKPGAWMEKIKEALAFPMYITAAWLIWVFTNQTNSNASLMLMLGLVLFAFSIWLWQQSKSKVFHMISVAVLAGSIFIAIPTSGKPTSHDILDGEPFTEVRLDELKKEGRRVFVYFSADWCITCKVNENISLYKDANRKLVTDRNIAILKGDWTNRNETIAKVLARHNRMGVPLYLYYASGADKPLILPEILTPNSLTDIFREK